MFEVTRLDDDLDIDESASERIAVHAARCSSSKVTILSFAVT